MGSRRILALVLLAVLVLSAACAATGRRPAGDERLRVVTTVYAVAEFTAAVGGERVAVELLAPPGAHAHDYEPTPRDLERILNADLFIYNGADFEPWVEEVLALIAASESRVRPVDASRGIELLSFAGDGGNGDDAAGAGAAVDHHVWLDPVRAARQVETIRQALTAADPDGAAAYRANAETYRARLAELDREFAAALAGCRLRDFVVEHGAFGYLADRYGLNQVAVAGLAADQEPTPRRLAELAAFMRQRGIKVVYHEPLAGPDTAQALAAEAGARLLTLHPLENLSDEESQRGASYLTVMRSNLDALRRGLDCGGS